MLLLWVAQLDWEPFLLAILIGLPSAVLYSYQISMVARHWSKFNSSFYILFINRAILNLLNLLASYLGQRFFKLGLFMPFYWALPRIVNCFFYFAPYYFFHAENLANFFLLLNRLSSIAHPQHYDRIWRRLLLPVLSVITLGPLAVTMKSFFVDTFLVKDQNGTGYTLKYEYYPGYKEWMPMFWRYGDNFYAALGALVFLVCCLSLNLATILYLRHKKVPVSANSASEQRKQEVERRLTVYALLSFLGQLMMALYYMFRYWQGSIVKSRLDAETYLLLSEIAYNHYGWVSDLSTVALPAWLMLWASVRVRRHFMLDTLNLVKFLRNCKRSDTSLTPVTLFAVKSQIQHMHNKNHARHMAPVEVVENRNGMA